MDVVCGCFVSAKTESTVQLQVIKVLLTTVTSPSCEVHETALLKAVQTCFNIFLFSRVPTNQVRPPAPPRPVHGAPDTFGVGARGRSPPRPR